MLRVCQTYSGVTFTTSQRIWLAFSSPFFAWGNWGSGREHLAQGHWAGIQLSYAVLKACYVCTPTLHIFIHYKQIYLTHLGDTFYSTWWFVDLMCFSGICRKVGSNPLKDDSSPTVWNEHPMGRIGTVPVLFFEVGGQWRREALCFNWSEHECLKAWLVPSSSPLVPVSTHFLGPCLPHSLSLSAWLVMEFVFVMAETVKLGNITVNEICLLVHININKSVFVLK